MNQINSFAKSHYFQTAALERTKRVKENMYLALQCRSTGGPEGCRNWKASELLKVCMVQTRDLGMRTRKKTNKETPSKFCCYVIGFRFSDESHSFRLPHFSDSQSWRKCFRFSLFAALTPPASFPKLQHTITLACTFSLSCLHAVAEKPSI